MTSLGSLTDPPADFPRHPILLGPHASEIRNKNGNRSIFRIFVKLTVKSHGMAHGAIPCAGNLKNIKMESVARPSFRACIRRGYFQVSLQAEPIPIFWE